MSEDDEGTEMRSYREGREARQNGKLETANPYPSGSTQHNLWREGWLDSDELLRALEALEPYQED